MLKEPLILASASPRRSALLSDYQIPFEVLTADVRELDAASAPKLTPVQLAGENARLKADAVAQTQKGAGRWILGADTIVVLNGRILGKPVSIDQAKSFLRALSGKTHEVITGCVLLDPHRKPDLFHVTTEVTFKRLRQAKIDRYVSEVNVLDKAGGYAVQEHGEWIVERVNGSWNNVVGLPVQEVESVLKKHDLI